MGTSVNEVNPIPSRIGRDLALDRKTVRRLVYSFDISRRGRSGLDEVQVDAVTGAIVSSKHESAATEVREKY